MAAKDSKPDLERWLGEEVARRAGLPAGRIEAHKPIASYGLDSLAAVELMHEIESRWGVAVELETLFSELSVGELAATLRGELAATAPASEPADAAAAAGAAAGDFRLSRAQLSLWFLHALEPDSPAYNVPNAVRVRGELDTASLLGALRLLVERHAALRTTFVAEHGEPVQRVAERGELEVAVHDAAAWSEARLAGYLESESRRPFDLERGPLLRLNLCSRSATEHVLLLAMHHIVTDFWSLGVLLDELAELYAAARAGRPPALPPPPPSYAEHALREERELAGAGGEALWAYWRERLAGELPVLELPTDRPRPRVQSTAGRALRRQLAAPLAGGVRRQAQAAATTPFVVLATAFAALLSRYSGQSDLLLGTVSATRTRAAFARTLGYFVNPLVLRAELAGDPGFAALVTRLRRDALGAFAHQDYPFPLLVERLQPRRDPGRSPLFQVMFVLQKAQLADGQDLTGLALGEAGARVELGGLALESMPLPQRIAQFDLTLTMGEVDGGLVASFDYNVDLFDAATVERLAGHFERLLAAALAEPERAVSELALLDDAERRQLVEVWNDTRAPYRDRAPLAELFEKQAAATPEAVAVIFAGRELTYAELDRRASRLALDLRRRGIGPEALVGVCVERSFDVLGAALGVLKAGAAYLPIDPDYPRERIAQLLADAGATLVLTQERLRPLLTGGEEEGGHGAGGAAGAMVPAILCLDAGGEPERAAPLGAAGGAATGAAAAATATAAAATVAAGPLPAGRRGRRALPANLACAIFTSGSTGRPKGVLLEHRNLVNLVASFARSYRPEPGDRILPLTSIAYASFVGEVFPLLCAGGAVVLPQKHELLEVAALVALIARHQVSMVSTVPSMLASLGALASQGGGLPRLRLLLVGGEALAAGDLAGLGNLLARSGELRLVNGYGLTETSICSTIHDVGPADLAAARQPPIGRPLPNQRVYVLDRHFEPRPIGCAGELYVAGDGIARGYAGRPDLTAERFLPDPFTAGGRLYRTGDLAAVQAGGDLVYLGRRDHQVKLRGFRIELAEIEAALVLHPGVRAAAAVVRGEGGAARLIGYVVAAAAAAPPTVGELLAWLRETLPDYMVPAALVFLDELPRNVHGKLDAARLPAPPTSRPELAVAYTAPRSELERGIAAVWREALQVDSVGLEDNFFDLGGHSLMMAKVHARLGETLGREVSLIELFQFPTIGSLARHLAGGGAAAHGGGAAGAAEISGGGGERAGRRPAAAGLAGGAPRAQSGIETDLAVIGLAGRFPGAADVGGLWLNLVAGREGITTFTAEELIAAGIDRELVERPDYVRAKGILGDVDLFDAQFFGLNPREVELMDPQHRIFLECAWQAMEDAGWDPARYAGQVGVYAGESMNTYLLMNLLSHMTLVASADTLQASLGNDKDPLTARVSYKLDLKGPSITIQSASSTSLVAVHSACQALINRDCDMALAGGVSIHLPEKSGYLYQEGGTVSRDGHCRAFDAASTGFVSGHGCGVVVLKRLSEAVADRDHVYAVIKGSACNNDGSHKVSFMAPSVDGQVQLYRLAYANAGIDPDTVSYVECHGTGTAIGDPIEIGALSKAFAAHTPRKGYCAIGSIKTNIGHLDTAAGVCGLIKAVLSLHHRTLPPTLHFRAPNPRIDFAGSPFFVNTELRPWEVAGGLPRRAGVTSLGMGGTNAHVVLEETPAAVLAAAAAPRAARPWQLLVLSARSAAALDRATARLAEHLRARPELPLADVAHTLQLGRKPFQHRRALVCRDTEAAAGALAALDPERVMSFAAAPGEHPVAFLFPGQGAQYPGMGRGLYEAEPVFRDAVDRCCELVPFDLRAALYGSATGAAGGGAVGNGAAGGAGVSGGGGGAAAAAAAAAAERLQRTEIAQPALFVISWATARLWLSWGVRPAALLGHSIGEYVAACLAGVFSLQDALTLVVERGRLMQRMAPGAMLAVPLPAAQVEEELIAGAGGGGRLSLAAVNRPDLCVVSGSPAAVEELAAGLAARGVIARRLHTSHAFHSPTADAILEPFTAAVRRVRLAAPSLPVVSNLTGSWLLAEEATDPAYWARQLRGTVRFADGLAQLLAEPQRILLEVGPGDTLASFAREHPARQPAQAVVTSLRHPKSAEDDAAVLQRAVARLWLAGGDFDWAAFGGAFEGRRVALPTYPFERRRYWVDPLPAETSAARQRAAGRREPGAWTHVPVWKQAPLPLGRYAGAQAAAPATATGSAGVAAGSGRNGGSVAHAGAAGPVGEASAVMAAVPSTPAAETAVPALSVAGAAAGSWLLLLDRAPASGAEADCGALLASRLVALGREVVRVHAGERFERLDAATYAVAPGSAADFEQLLASLGRTPTHVIHLWPLVPGDGTEVLDRGFYSLLHLAQALGRRTLAEPVSLAVVTGGLHEVTGEEAAAPLAAMTLGLCGVIPREVPGLACRAVDLLPPADARAAAQAVEQILAETARPAGEPWVALRRGQRFVRGFEPLALAPAAGTAAALPCLRLGGVCLVTGGLEGAGLELAEHLARQSAARLVLVGGSPLPDRESWQSWVAAHGEDDPTSHTLRRLLALEQLGAEVLVLAADPGAAAVVAAAERRFGAVHAVIHAAGVLDAGAVPFQEMTREAAARALEPAVRGALALAGALNGRQLDFFVLASSLAAAVPLAGTLAQGAAGAVFDVLAARLARSGVPAVAISWDGWLAGGSLAGGAVAGSAAGGVTATAAGSQQGSRREASAGADLTVCEAVEVFDRVVGGGLPNVLVSAVPLDELREQRQGEERRRHGAGRTAQEGGEAPAEDASPVDRDGSGAAGGAAAGGTAHDAHPRPALANPYVAPQSDLERQIAAICEEVLGVDRVGLHDNFFELGGNSLAGLRVVGRIKERLSAGISEVSLYEAPTVAALARLIDAERQPEAAAAATFESSRSRGERRKAAQLQKRRGSADGP